LRIFSHAMWNPQAEPMMVALKGFYPFDGPGLIAIKHKVSTRVLRLRPRRASAHHERARIFQRRTLSAGMIHQYRRLARIRRGI